jgi:hypothetical protein
MKVLEEFKIFTLDVDSEKFVPVKGIEHPLKKVLDSTRIYLILDPHNSKVWIWKGSEANIRMKFMAAQLAPNIRNRYAVDYNIAAVDENNENDEFKELLH